MQSAKTSRLTDLVAQLPQFAEQRPLTLTPLPGGFSNRTYLMRAADTERYIVRIDTDTRALFNRSRAEEIQLLRMVADKGIAPKPLFYDENLRVTVFEYVEGSLVKPNEATSPGFCESLRHLLATVYACRLQGAQLNLAQTMDSYHEKLIPRGQSAYARLQKLHQRLRPLVFALDALKNEYRLTHLDLGPGNLLWHSEGHLVALDWEYACRYHPMLDLAIIANNWQLTQEQMVAIAPDNAVVRWQIFPQIRVLARYLESLWYAVQACHDDNHDWQPMVERCLEEVERDMRELYL